MSPLDLAKGVLDVEADDGTILKCLSNRLDLRNLKCSAARPSCPKLPLTDASRDPDAAAQDASTRRELQERLALQHWPRGFV